MFRRKQCAIVVVLMFLVCLVVGCGKEKEPVERKHGSEKRAARQRERRACEKTLAGFLDALAVEDYERAAEFLDVEEMLHGAQEVPSPTWRAVDADAMRERLIQMMKGPGTGEEPKRTLTYEVLGSRVSGDRATVEVEVYRDGKLSPTRNYDLNKRDGQWKVRASAVPALASPL